MNIVKDIEAFLSSEALRSRELFSRFALLHKQEEWYYVGTHPAPPGVTPVQGPRRAWRWNATLARRQGATEESIAAAVKGKTAEQATAQAVAQAAQAGQVGGMGIGIGTPPTPSLSTCLLLQLLMLNSILLIYFLLIPVYTLIIYNK